MASKLPRETPPTDDESTIISPRPEPKAEPEPRIEPELDTRTPKEKLDAALRASGVDIDSVPPPSGKYILAITPGSVMATVTADEDILAFGSTVSEGQYAQRRIFFRFMTRNADLLKYDLAVKQGVAGLSAWIYAVDLDPERDLPPRDPDDPEKSLRTIGMALWAKGRGLKLEVEIEVNARGFINVKNVRRVE